MSIRIPADVEADARALLARFAELSAGELVAQLAAIDGVDPLAAIAAGVHTGVYPLVRFAMRLGIDALGGRAPTAPAAVSRQPDLFAPVDSESNANNARTDDNARGAGNGRSTDNGRSADNVRGADSAGNDASVGAPMTPARFRELVSARLENDGAQLERLAEECSARGADWTAEHVALIVTMMSVRDGSPAGDLPVSAREALVLATDAGYLNRVQVNRVKPLTMRTFNNHRRRVEAAISELSTNPSA